MKQKDIKSIIRNYFYLNPTIRLRIRHIEKKLKIPLPSTIRYVKELCEEKILRKIIISNVVFYAADITSAKYQLEKKLYNIRKIYDSGLIEYLTKEYNNPLIILFGSYSRGQDIENSDIDLYIETTKKIDIDKYETILKKQVQTFTEKLNKMNKELANNIINGVILNGYLEVFK